MTQEDKQLLFKDLSSRLPYGVRIYTKENGKDTSFVLRISDLDFIFDEDRIDVMYDYDGWKPYLRSMSSMTEEEKKIICSMNMLSDIELSDRLNYPKMYVQNYTIETFDLFNTHNLDYRGLIEKGLALEAPEEMYKNE